MDDRLANDIEELQNDRSGSAFSLK